MPKHKYSYGPELREHADRIATKWNLKGLFRAQVKSQEWHEDRKQWKIVIDEYRGPKEDTRHLTVWASFAIVTGGLLNIPHIPKLPGLDEFEGQHFHTARWNYGVTGGSPENQQLENLKGKKVGIIGTGATAIQVIPELAKWADQLYIFQRTPSACDVRGQHPTDPEEWKTKIANKQGWQRARCDNFASWLCGVTSHIPI